MTLCNTVGLFEIFLFYLNLLWKLWSKYVQKSCIFVLWGACFNNRAILFRIPSTLTFDHIQAQNLMHYIRKVLWKCLQYSIFWGAFMNPVWKHIEIHSITSMFRLQCINRRKYCTYACPFPDLLPNLRPNTYNFSNICDAMHPLTD